ncbi:sigma factor [Dactylosporangium sp. NPDC050588]|uniref:sigma factor n=1 Tax=Dactylosporangium sp. NPDC050588 TaxID=3157211 RepID=UPI0033E88598
MELADADWASHRPAVFGAAYRILGSVTEAEDVTQEVWLRAAAPPAGRSGAPRRSPCWRSGRSRSGAPTRSRSSR